MADLDLYAILDVSPEDDSVAVERAYWRLVREHQRMAFVSPDALDRLNQAYEVLGTPSLRREYDESRRGEVRQTEVVQEAEADAPARLAKHRTRGGLMRFARRHHEEPKKEPPNLAAALPEPRTNARSEEAAPVTDSEQLRSSTASLVERWRRNSRAIGENKPLRADG